MLPHDDIWDAELDGWLHTLGVTSRCEWDVLVFLYRHQSSLVGADFIARLLGYANTPVVAALDVLEGLGLVKRSRVSQMVRFYQFTIPSVPPRSEAWASLLAFAGDRGGRVRLATHLRGGDQTAQGRRQAAQGFLAGAQQALRATRQRQQSRRGDQQPWLKAI